MIIIPAIDIIEGKVVRPTKGEYSSKKNYSLSPVEAAKSFADAGATHLHVVDLDGAKSGRADNALTIEKIVTSCNLKVEVGGGIRSFEQIDKYIEYGTNKIILGTIAIKNFDFTCRASAKYGNKLAVGIDAKDGFVAINGWQETTNIAAIDFCKKLEEIGINNIIYTDIAKDGMLSGTNLEIYKVLCQTLNIKITASGGISDIKEIQLLKQIGVYGAILGKSLYEGKIDLRQAIKAVGENNAG